MSRTTRGNWRGENAQSPFPLSGPKKDFLSKPPPSVKKECKMTFPVLPPPASAGTGDDLLSPPQPYRITHGPCDFYFENLAGKTVGSVRRGLATVFSIPGDAEAFVGGSLVDGLYRLRAGDSVLFLRRGWGRKGRWSRRSLLFLRKKG